MTIYIIIALCLLSFALLSEFGYFKNSKTAKAAFLSVGSAILFFVSAFRFDVGADYRPYTNAFNNLVILPTIELANQRMEKGYIFVNRYIQLFINDFQMLFVVISLIVILLVYAMLLRYCKNPSLGLLCFYLLGFYFNSMNFMRNVIAALIVVFAYKYIKEKSFMKFIVVVLLASTFHISALAFIPFYFIFKFKFNYITLVIYSIIWGILYIFSKPTMEYVTKYVYTSYSPLTSINMFSGIPIMYSMFVFVILVCAIMLKNDIEKNSEWGSMLICATYMHFYFLFIGAKHSILSRFDLYFGPIMAMILIPDIIRISYINIKTKPNQKIIYKIRDYVCLIGTCVGCVGFFSYALYKNYNLVIPHEWIWNVR
jgi:hypothetical protein